jgi:hypothetical protein
MTVSDEDEERRNGWVTAIMMAKAALDEDDQASYELTEMSLYHVLDAFAKLLRTALRVNATLALNLSREQIAAFQARAVGHDEEINRFARDWLDHQMTRIMLHGIGDVES